MNTSTNNTPEPSGWRIIFWIIWTLLLVLIPFYGFTFYFETGVIKQGDLSSKLSPVVGILVLFAQIAVFIISYKQINRSVPLSKPYLTLIGGSILIAFIWVGGCAMMGPWNMH